MDLSNLLALMLILGGSLSQRASNCRESYIFGNSHIGVHDINGPGNKNFHVFCQFESDGSGLVFPSRDMFNATGTDPFDLSFLYSGQDKIVIRIFNKDGTQSDTTIKQLPAYSTEGIDVFVNAHLGYSPGPLNPTPYIYVGLLKPAQSSVVGATLGFLTNEQTNTYRQCDNNPSNRFVFYPDKNTFPGNHPSSSPDYDLFKKWMASKRHIASYNYLSPAGHFQFRAEIAFGGCGTLTPSSMWPDANYAALGLPFANVRSRPVFDSTIDVEGCRRFSIGSAYNTLESTDNQACTSHTYCTMISAQPVNTATDCSAFHVNLNLVALGQHVGNPGIAFNVQDLNNFDFVFFRLGDTAGVHTDACIHHGYAVEGSYYYDGHSSCTGSTVTTRQWFLAAIVTKNDQAHIQLNGIQYATFNAHFPSRAHFGILLSNMPQTILEFTEAKLVY